jgi:ADP-ribosylglycohydrolase
LLASSPYQGIGLAIEHQNLTHRSENNVAALSVLVPLLHELVSGTDGERTTISHARQIRLPIVTGSNLFARYRQANGPGNIPNEEMWQLHTRLDDVPMDIPQLLNTFNQETMTHDRLATACYPEHGLPMMLYLAVQKRFDLESALLANANAGGDNVHRGMVLGLLVGAASEEVPTMLKTGLVDHVELATEIEAFSEMAVTSAAF